METSNATAAVLPRLVEQRHEFLAFLERRLGDRALAEDILQDAFAHSAVKLAQLAHEESAKAWFYRVLRNAVTDYRRRAGANARKLEAFGHELDSRPEPETEAAICQCVKGLAATLKPEYAAALQAVEVDGVAVKDFASTAGITSSNAGVRLFRAREALRLQVKRCCGSCADNECRDCTCHAQSEIR